MMISSVQASMRMEQFASQAAALAQNIKAAMEQMARDDPASKRTQQAGDALLAYLQPPRGDKLNLVI